MKKFFFTCSFFIFGLLSPALIFAQAAILFDGINKHAYTTLIEAVAAAGSSAFNNPFEITLLVDIDLDEPIIIENDIHIVLVPLGDRTIRRGDNLINYPVIWVQGEASSLHLGKPGMEHELVIDGGYSDKGIFAHAPLLALSGQDAKLFMYDKVFLQNNYNNGDIPGNSHYQNGSGVNIRTFPENSGRQAEFIMKGGTIRGNTNAVLSRVARGGGVLIRGFGIFTMEGGMIMNNTAQMTGGGFHSDSRGTFIKSGGIIYGAGVPAGFRNTALDGIGTPPVYGHAISVSIVDHQFFNYRNDTITENEYLSYKGTPVGNGVFGKKENWYHSDDNLHQHLIIVILVVFAFAVTVFLVIWKLIYRKRVEAALANSPARELNLEGFNLSLREEEICRLLLTDLSMKQIASAMKIDYTTADYHAKRLYRKLDIQGRTELFVKMRSK